MKSIFWPVYLVFAVVGSVLVWMLAPSFRSGVPEDLRTKWANGVASLSGIDLEGMEYARAEREREAREEELRAAAAAEAAARQPVRPRPRAMASRKVQQRPAEDSQAPAYPAQEVATYRPPRPQPQEEAPRDNYDPIPSTLGIMQTDYREAKWGIVNAITPYKALSDGEEAGNAGVGSVFVVEQRQPADGGGMEFIGNFRNRPHDEPVVIPAAKLYCFTGSYDSLTPRQRAALSSYYKLRAEAEKLKREISRESGSKSPYFAKAVEAKAKWDEMVKTVESLEASLRTDKKANASQIRDKLARMKGEMAVQQAKLKELSAKHKEWKEKNPSQVVDPDEDSRIKDLRARMQGFARMIPGLAF